MMCKSCGKAPCMCDGGKMMAKGGMAKMPRPKKMEGVMMEEKHEPMDEHEPKHEEHEDMSGIDDELMDMAAGECMEAFEKKDKKGLLDALKAIILSCRE